MSTGWRAEPLEECLSEAIAYAGGASTETELAAMMPQEWAVSPEGKGKPRNGGWQAVAPWPPHGVETPMAPNRKSRLRPCLPRYAARDGVSSMRRRQDRKVGCLNDASLPK